MRNTYTRRGTPRRIGGGFTLIELRVVVAIIALLISILLPSLSRAREAARTVKCAATYKQFGVAEHMYADANNGNFTQTIWFSDQLGGWVAWWYNPTYSQIMGVPQGQYPEGLFCPALPDREMGDEWWMGAKNQTGLPWVQTAPGRGIEGGHRTSIQMPASTLQLTDGNDNRTYAHFANYELFWDQYGDVKPPRGGTYAQTSYRHNEGANALFFDGHVARMSKEEMYPQDNDERVQLWLIYKD